MIEVRFTKAHPGFALDVDFTVPGGGITALFGRNGAGKTSIVHAVAGALRPDAGRIEADGRVFFDSQRGIDMPIERRRVGLVFQDSRLFPHLSVAANLDYGRRRLREASRFARTDIVELLGLGPLLERRVHRLSGGERQRVAIGRALLAEPALLVMDEPLAALDPPRKSELLPYIESLRDELRLPILYISHAFEEVVRLADHLVIVDNGRVARAGPLMELASDPVLSPLVGRFEAGSVIAATVIAHDAGADLSTLGFDGGTLRVPRVALEIGDKFRIRIRARDVALAVAEPSGLSVTNVIEGRIAAISEQGGPYAEVLVAAGGTMIRSLVTRESVARLALRPSQRVWALIKTVAFDGRTVGALRRERSP